MNKGQIEQKVLTSIFGGQNWKNSSASSNFDERTIGRKNEQTDRSTEERTNSTDYFNFHWRWGSIDYRHLMVKSVNIYYITTVCTMLYWHNIIILPSTKFFVMSFYHAIEFQW